MLKGPAVKGKEGGFHLSTISHWGLGAPPGQGWGREHGS